MEFSRMGKHTIKCKITEDEIFDMGYTLDEIMSNGSRTQEFMNNIFELAEKEFQTKFELGMKTVRADFLSDHTLTLTFSEHPVSGSDMMEHLKDIVSGLLNSIPQAKWDEINQKKAALGAGISENVTQENAAQVSGNMADGEVQPVEVFVLIKFLDMENVIRFSKQIPFEGLPQNNLYKYNGEFYLFIDLSDSTEQEVLKLSMLTDEYANDIEVGAQRVAFMEEHAELIIEACAIEELREL